MIGLVSAAGAAVMSVAGAIAPGVARADDPPALPNINAFAPVKTSEYAVMDNNWYAFRTPDGLTCVLQRSGGYGCSGPIPAAPNGANLVSGGPGARDSPALPLRCSPSRGTPSRCPRTRGSATRPSAAARTA